MGCNQVEDFDYWDDDPFGEYNARNDGKAGIIVMLLFIILFAFVMVIDFGILNNSQTENSGTIKDEELATVYDSPTNILVEHEDSCPECGNVSMAVNDNIVCRNEDCPNYGLAVHIDWTENLEDR